MSYILVIWTVVGGATNYHGADRDWRPIGTFLNQAACHKAAESLGSKTYRCLATGGAA